MSHSLPRIVGLAAACFAFSLLGCRPGSPPAQRQVTIGWRPVASWAGSANYQTESFEIHTGQWRIQWEASAQPSAKRKTIRIIVHSSVSGRFVVTAVDHPGPGKGTAYLAEDPRAFFLEVESTALNWKINVEEGVTADR